MAKRKANPMHAIEVEMKLLGALFCGQDEAAYGVTLLKEEDFYRTTHRLIFRAISDLVAAGHTVDQFTVIDKLESKGELAKLTADDPAAYVRSLAVEIFGGVNETHAKIIRDRSKARRLVSLLTTITSEAKESFEPDEVRLHLAEQVRAYDEGDVQGRHVSLNELMHVILDMEKPESFSTGFHEFDKRYQGGLHPGLTILAGPTGSGKTTLQAQWGLAAAKQGHKQMWFMGDMSREKLGIYLVAGSAGLTEEELWSKTHYEAKLAACSELAGLPVTLYDGYMELSKIIQTIEVAVIHGCRWFLVDSLQLVDVPGESVEWQATTKVSRAFRKLASQRKIYILATCEWKKRDEPPGQKAKRCWPTKADAKGGGGAFHAADELIICWPPWEQTSDEEQRGGLNFWLIVDKSRSGAVPSKTELVFQGAKHRFVPGVPETKKA